MVSSVNSSVPLSLIKKRISEGIDKGDIGPSIIESLIVDDKIIGVECELWDFKKGPSGDATDLAKTILQIVCFHNTYGGYLLYGIEEASEGVVRPVGIEPEMFDSKKLRDKLRSYTSETIDVAYSDYSFKIGSWEGNLGVLFVPKRAKGNTPIFFGKNGPSVGNNKLLFEKDKTYIRIQDNCEPVEKKKHHELLYGERRLEFDEGGNFNLTREEPLFNNLPDRNLICPKFVGRDKIIDELWRWLGDPLSYIKLLAGDGGKGKSSIAYEFAEEICRVRPYEFEWVFWLTGKRKQFVANQNKYQDTPETHFFNLESLLVALSEQLGVLEDELKESSINQIKKNLREHLRVLPSFIVIDDIDSLELEEQKRVFETVLQLTGGESRFLLTTRMNISYSSDACITVPGLERVDYEAFVKLFEKRFNILVDNNHIGHMLKVTDGSPLFTESLLRLVVLGESIPEAIRAWKGKNGDDVREAALKREIQLLTPESRRVLYALAFMTDASGSELRQVTGYTINKFEKCIDELSTLFLIFSPPIIQTENRYRVFSNTALLVHQSSKALLADPKVIETNIKKLREVNVKGNKRFQHQKVGSAINQAIALLKENRAEEAIKTINVTLSEVKNNKDLLFVKARCLMRTTPPSLNEARKQFQLAYSFGQRKNDFFEHWYSSEISAQDPVSIIEVTTSALDNEPNNRIKWLERRAKGHWMLSKVYSSSANYNSAISALEQGVNDVYDVASKSCGGAKHDAFELIRSFHDEIWEQSWLGRDVDSTIKAFDASVSAINYGDMRSVCFYRMVKSIEWLVYNTSDVNEKWINFLEQHLFQANKLLAKAKDDLTLVEVYKKCSDKLNTIKDVLSELESALS